MSPKEVCQKLAASFYYGSPERDKKVQFEQLGEEQQRLYTELATTALVGLSKLGLQPAPIPPEGSEAQADAILRGRIEAVVRDFFRGIKVWKADAIPQAELVARLMQAWMSL